MSPKNLAGPHEMTPAERRWIGLLERQIGQLQREWTAIWLFGAENARRLAKQERWAANVRWLTREITKVRRDAREG